MISKKFLSFENFITSPEIIHTVCTQVDCAWNKFLLHVCVVLCLKEFSNVAQCHIMLSYHVATMHQWTSGRMLPMAILGESTALTSHTLPHIQLYGIFCSKWGKMAIWASKMFLRLYWFVKLVFFKFCYQTWTTLTLGSD